MTMIGPLSQKPWQPVFRMSTASRKPCFLISSSRLAATFPLPEAWQADPEQRVMQGLFGSLFDMISFLNSSNSAGEFIRDVLSLLIVFQHIFRLGRRHLAVMFAIHDHHRPQTAAAGAAP